MENKDQQNKILPSSAGRQNAEVGHVYASSGEVTQKANTVDSNEISLKELILKMGEWWRYLLAMWLTILIVGIAGGLIGLAYAFYKKPIYTAATTFVLESGEGGGGMGQYAGLASMVGIDLGGGGSGIFQGDNIIELYKSRTMIEKALLSTVELDGENQLLIDRYIHINDLRQGWAKKPELANIRFDTKRENFNRVQDSILGIAVKNINKNNLVVSKLDKKLSIMLVEVKSEDEIFSKLFNDQIVKTVNDFYVQTKTKKSLENVTILQQKVDSVRAVMEGAIYRAASVSDATPNLNLTRQVQRSAPIQRSQFTAETNKAILGELVKNLEMSKIALRKETPLIQVVDQPVFPLYKEKLGTARGLILGGIIGGILVVMLLLVRKLFKEILS